MTSLNTNLAAFPGSSSGDAQRDRVVVEGTDGVDRIVVGGSSGAVAVSGLAWVVTISGIASLNDVLAINTLAWADTVDTSPLAPNPIGLSVRQQDLCGTRSSAGSLCLR